MRGRFLLAFVVGAAGVIAGCGGSGSRVFSDYTGEPEKGRVLLDLIDRAASAEVMNEVTSVDFSSPAAASAMVSGWDRPEVLQETGKGFAWTVAETAVVEFNLFDTDHHRLELSARMLPRKEGPPQIVTVTLNGRDLGRVELVSRFSDYSLVVPPGLLAVGTNRLELRCAWVGRPADLVPDSTDRRSLGAAFRRVALAAEPTKVAGGGEVPRPAVDGDRLFLAPGSGLRYRFTAPEDGFLELKIVHPVPGESVARALVWVAEPGRPAADAIFIDPATVTDDSTRWTMTWPAGTPVELGLAAVGEGGSEAGFAVVRGRVRGESGGDEDVPNVLLIVVDTLRADYLGVYGADLHTPTVDGLAARGVRFSNARSHIPITGPSHASLFTSLLPMETGVHNNAQHLAENLPTLAESMRMSGRRTAAVVSLGVLKRDFGFDRGFDHYGDDFPRDWMKDAVEVTDEALAAAADRLDGPYFFWLHYSDPHEPYAPLGVDYPTFDLRLDGESIGTMDARGRGFWFDIVVPPGESTFELVPLDRDPDRIFRVDNLSFHDEMIDFEPTEGWEVIHRRMGRTTLQSSFPASIRVTNRSEGPTETRLLVSVKEVLNRGEIRRAYSREVEIVDREIGRLLAGLEERGMLRNTLVVFASDHGEGLGDHKQTGHISQLYDSLLHVPLVFVWPGRLPAGLVVDDPVGLVDVFPTLSDLLGTGGPEASSGASLVPLMRGEQHPARPFIAATYRPEAGWDMRAILVDGFKYIHSWRDEKHREELFDLADDPGELKNLAKAQPGMMETLRAELARRLAEIAEQSPVEAELSDEDRDNLQALGYIH